MELTSVKKHDMYIKFKSYKVKLLEKLVVLTKSNIIAL